MVNEKMIGLKQKKGTIVLRSLMFMLVVFAAIMSLSMIFISEMATTYDNDAVVTEVGNMTMLGPSMLGSLNKSTGEMKGSVDGSSGLFSSFTSITGIINGATTILRLVLFAPIYASNALGVFIVALSVPTQIAYIITTLISIVIYIIVIFVIISSLLKGGKL